MKLIFSTNNENKVLEVRAILYPKIEILSLIDLGVTEDIPEEQDTLEGNALQKAEWVFSRFNLPCIADDTGLEVEALGGRPGVHSARYAGEGKNPIDNINKLLLELKGKENRKARFRTVICLIDDQGPRYFDGIVEGRISEELSGDAGFGYDPIFIPDGYDLTFAQMSKEEKNAISHRGRAIQAFVKYLEKQV